MNVGQNIGRFEVSKFLCSPAEFPTATVTTILMQMLCSEKPPPKKGYALPKTYRKDNSAKPKRSSSTPS